MFTTFRFRVTGIALNSVVILYNSFFICILGNDSFSFFIIFVYYVYDFKFILIKKQREFRFLNYFALKA